MRTVFSRLNRHVKSFTDLHEADGCRISAARTEFSTLNAVAAVADHATCSWLAYHRARVVLSELGPQTCQYGSQIYGLAN